jgi:hypothetical protein
LLLSNATCAATTRHIHHVILHEVAHDYDLSMEEYCNARAFDVQFGHDADWWGCTNKLNSADPEFETTLFQP